MGNEILELKTSDSLLNALHEACLKKLSAQEILEQRVSFVFGSLGADSSVTREKVRQILVEQDGVTQ